VTVEVWLRTARMREAGRRRRAVERARSPTCTGRWAQLLAHHASNGCNLRPGRPAGERHDVGPARDARGCLLERTCAAPSRSRCPGGETRAFLEDGDEVILRAHCARAGATRIGFGECRGVVTSAERSTPPGGQRTLAG
jgi:fumarylacetoacetase